jgi:membrane-associated protease RseP (regulator of RpoE activity)
MRMRCAWALFLAGVVLAPAGFRVAASDVPVVNPAMTQATSQYWFGVGVENIPPYFAKQLKLGSEQGLLVMAVMQGSPAEAAGLRQYDLLESLDGAAVTSQEDLARAANAMEMDNGVARPKTTVLGYRREGDLKTVHITATLRPPNMLVYGGDIANFSARAASATMPSGGEGTGLTARNYVLPNGGAAQVGPGYQMNLNGSDGSTLSMKSIKEFVQGGQTIVLTQETDAAGEVRHTITVGEKTYKVEPGKLDALPVELQPLGEKLLNGETAVPVSDEQKVQKLEAENAELRRKLKETEGK